jgi:hypothetical protein
MFRLARLERAFTFHDTREYALDYLSVEDAEAAVGGPTA